jgi:hypothetical protein
MFVTFGKIPSLEKNKLLYECKALWNIIMKEIEILVFKSFGVIYNCGKSIVR